MKRSAKWKISRIAGLHLAKKFTKGSLFIIAISNVKGLAGAVGKKSDFLWTNHPYKRYAAFLTASPCKFRIHWLKLNPSSAQ